MKNKYGSGRPLFFFLFIYRFWYLVIYSHTYTIFKLPKSIFTYPFTFIFFFFASFLHIFHISHHVYAYGETRQEKNDKIKF